jgi:two-component system, LytTR family, sensor kinase
LNIRGENSSVTPIPARSSNRIPRFKTQFKPKFIPIFKPQLTPQFARRAHATGQRTRRSRCLRPQRRPLQRLSALPSTRNIASVSIRVPARLWLFILIGCAIAGALDVLQSWLRGDRVGSMVFQGGEWVLLGALTPITYYLGRRWPLRGPGVSRAIAVHVGGALLLCFGWASFGIVLRRELEAWGPVDTPFVIDWLIWLGTSLPWSFFIYFTILGCMHAFTYYVEARDNEAQAARLHGQLAEARLDALRMQIQPHFLFNSLNAILVLVRDQNTRVAARMLEQLSDMLRQVLRTDQPHEVAVDEELTLVRQYLAIEQIRFSDRLQIRYAVSPGLERARVPRFILQPLVENALRHGVAQQTDTVQVEIGAERKGDFIELWVRDDGPGPGNTRGTGVGLENTRSRLATLYGDRASLELATADGGGTIARIRLPYREISA